MSNFIRKFTSKKFRGITQKAKFHLKTIDNIGGIHSKYTWIGVYDVSW